jgi:hypothetical protein
MKPKKNSNLNESSLNDLLEAYACLPQNWRVIYHEAFRGNHLLFDSRDVEQFGQAAIKQTTRTEKKHALRAAVKLASSTNLTDMKMQISGLGVESKYYLFRLYLRYVASLREQVKSHLN